MSIQTAYIEPIATRLGEIWVAPEDIIQFPEGIPAFTEAKRFVVVTQPEIAPFGWLLAVDEPDLAFVVVRPADVLLPLGLNAEELAQVELTNVEEALVLAIIVVGHSPEETTANLLAPVIINLWLQIGKQIIRNDNIELAWWPLEPRIVNDRKRRLHLWPRAVAMPPSP